MTKITEDALFIDQEGLKYSDNFMVEWIKRRVLEYNKNFLGICCGATGSAKTYSMIRVCELIDPSFGVDNIVFTPSEFMGLINSGRLQKGACILYEEAGTSIDRRSWYSISNKMINYVLQTFRHLNLTVIFTTPSLTYIDSNSVKLFHCYFETTGIDKEHNVSKVRPKLIQTNAATGKTYMKYLRVFMNSQLYVMDELVLKLASKPLLAAYEIKRKQFTEALNKRVAAEVRKIENIEGFDGKGKLENISNQNVITETERKVYLHHAEGMNLYQISEITRLRPDKIKAILIKLKNKGIEVL